jgi:hypothetical protein
VASSVTRTADRITPLSFDSAKTRLRARHASMHLTGKLVDGLGLGRPTTQRRRRVRSSTNNIECWQHVCPHNAFRFRQWRAAARAIRDAVPPSAHAVQLYDPRSDTVAATTKSGATQIISVITHIAIADYHYSTFQYIVCTATLAESDCEEA